MKKIPVLALTLLLSLAFSAAAEENTGAKWENSLALGLNLNKGNSDNLLANLSILAERKGDPNELRLGIEGNYGETEVTRSDGTTENDTNVQNAKAFLTYRRLLDERNYLAFHADLNHDDIADIDYRLITGPAVGRYFLKDAKQELSAEVGVDYINEKLAGETDDRFALRLAERYELKVSDTSKVWESVEYLPALDDFGQYLLNAELGAEAAMNAHLSLRVVLSDKYNSEPAPGKDENDLTLVAGVTYKM